MRLAAHFEALRDWLQNRIVTSGGEGGLEQHLAQRPPSSCDCALAPELNPVENVWQYLRANKLAITVFDTCDDILDACCTAWNFLASDPKMIASITSRAWEQVS